MTMKKLSIFLSLLLLLTACGKSDDVEQTVAPNTPELPTNPDTPGTPDEDPDTPDVPSTPGGELNGHEFVDLGLPSGTLWATTNVGAATPADYGDYFAWGETAPKENYSWNTYKWCNGSYNTLTKYNTDSYYGTVDNNTVLEAADDAATANWGSGWRMPTLAELQELDNTDYCTWTWATKTNSKEEAINGYLVTSKSNGNSIFLPATGYYYFTLLHEAGSVGNYWSSSLNSDDPNYAYFRSFTSHGHHSWGDGHSRHFAHSVRPVRTSPRN